METLSFVCVRDSENNKVALKQPEEEEFPRGGGTHTQLYGLDTGPGLRLACGAAPGTSRAGTVKGSGGLNLPRWSRAI